jgi:hypothetical protein
VSDKLVTANLSDRLVTIATFEIAPRAHVARAALEDAGIQVFVADEEIVGMDWMLSNAVGGVKVKVREADAERALAVLDARFASGEPQVSEEELAAEAEAAPREDAESEPREDAESEPPPAPPAPAPSEPAEVLSPREDYARRLFFVAWFAMAFFPVASVGMYFFAKAAFGPGELRGRHRYNLFVGGLVLLLPALLCVLVPWLVLTGRY